MHGTVRVKSYYSNLMINFKYVFAGLVVNDLPSKIHATNYHRFHSLEICWCKAKGAPVSSFSLQVLSRFSHYKPVLPSYGNQTADLLCKSIEWFLYEGNTGI